MFIDFSNMGGKRAFKHSVNRMDKRIRKAFAECHDSIAEAMDQGVAEFYAHLLLIVEKVMRNQNMEKTSGKGKAAPRMKPPKDDSGLDEEVKLWLQGKLGDQTAIWATAWNEINMDVKTEKVNIPEIYTHVLTAEDVSDDDSDSDSDDEWGLAYRDID